MKKYLFALLVIASVITAVSCVNKTPSNPSPSGTNTVTPTITETYTITETTTITSTPTITPTFTATPDIFIDAFINAVNSTINYWFVLKVNGSSYQYATITVNTHTLVYNGTGAYIESGATGAYVAGIDYAVTILTQYGTYTGTIFGPGGNVNIVSDVVNYSHNGNADFIIVRNPSNAISFNSTAPEVTVDPGFTIPGSAFIAGAGNYNVSVYPMNDSTSAFTGPTVPSTNHLFVETTVDISVIKP